jgi:two-component system chemotaxis response regulator CheY
MPKKIITVDDAMTMRRMVSFTLQEAGHQVLEAADGVAALNLLRNERVDLVISDVNMPNMDGITLTRRLRELNHFKTIPIILLTTESAPEVKAQGRAAGATGWMVKPFKPEQLLALVQKLFPN